MTERQTSYRQIMKATSLFGGVQLFTIIITIIRSKVIAVLLGPVGIGIHGLLLSTTGFIGGLTNFGLGKSAIKDVAAAHSTTDINRVSTVVTVLGRLVWITGLLGTLITIILSPLLSQIAFGNKEYTLAFIWISITLLLNQISEGQSVVLRGMRKLKYIARSSLSGALLGLFVSLPIYFIWSLDGIVPAIILTSFASLLRTWYYARKVKLEKVDVTYSNTFFEGKEMLVMGFMLSISGFYVLGKNFGIRAFISNAGGLEQVGLYTAGFAIVNNYVGMVFTAMSTDYYPRLSAIARDNIQTRILVNQQGEIALLILAPIIMIFIVFITWIVVLLYSDKFLQINRMIQWAAIGTLFKALSWSLAYLFLARGDSKLYLGNELFAGTITLIFHLLGYYLGGLTGMGIGFMLGYAYYFGQVYFVCARKYKVYLEREIIIIFLIQFSCCIICFTTVTIFDAPISYMIGSILILVSSLYSYKELENRIGLKELVKNIIK